MTLGRAPRFQTRLAILAAISAALCAGNALAEPYVRLVPVDPREYGVAPYEEGARIVGTTIYLEAGRAHRVWLEARVGGWASHTYPNGVPGRLRNASVGILLSSLASGSGAPLSPSSVSCNGDHEFCRDTVGDWGSGTNFGCLDDGGTSCLPHFVQCCRGDELEFFAHDFERTSNLWWCFRYEGPPIFADLGDNGRDHYAATFALDVPADASGTYTIDFDVEHTRLQWSDTFGDTIHVRIPATIKICTGAECQDPNRYLSFVPGSFGPPGGGVRCARVQLIESEQFADRVGAIFWGTPTARHPDIGGVSTFLAAPLSCTGTPMTVLPAEDEEAVYLYGYDVAPGCTYEIRVGHACCPNLLCMPNRVFVRTGSWADIAAPFANALQPDFLDISAVVDAFRALPGAMGKTRTQLAGESVNPANNISFLDIGAAVDAFRGSTFQYGGPQTCP